MYNTLIAIQIIISLAVVYATLPVAKIVDHSLLIIFAMKNQ